MIQFIDLIPLLEIKDKLDVGHIVYNVMDGRKIRLDNSHLTEIYFNPSNWTEFWVFARVKIAKE